MKLLAPRDLAGLARRAIEGWIEDNASSMGASLAFYNLFSLAPLLLVAIAVAGIFVDRATAQQLLLTQLTGMVGDNAGAAIASLIEAAGSRNQNRFPALIGLAVLALGATSVFVQLRNDLDRIWRCEPPKSRGLMRFIGTRARSFAMIVGIGFLLLLSVVASTTLTAIGDRWLSAPLLAHAADFALSFLIVTALFAMIYKFLPSTRIAWGDVWVGAAATSLLFYAGKMLIALYIAKASPASSFGAAGTVVVVIVWVYYSAQIFYLGAEFTRQYALLHGSRRGDPEGSMPAHPVAANEEHLVHRAEKIVRGEDPVLLRKK
jgi:membrane protein